MLVAGMLSVSLLAAPVPQTRCTIDDRRLAELSGLAVADDRLWAVVDGGRQVRVHRLDPTTCAVVETRTADIDPVDVEDLARGPDGALWVGDIGDNERRREDVAVIVLPSRGGALLHRLVYPDGPHDAEALLVDDVGRPVVVTKEARGPAGIYRTAGAPEGLGPTPLIRVGEVALPASETSGGPLGALGSRLVTGAAASADGKVVALRSYTDAWLYPVAGGDIAAALAANPVQVPLPNEPQGEAIAFQPDGTLVSGSEARNGVRGEIRAVSGVTELLAGVLAAAPAGQAGIDGATEKPVPGTESDSEAAAADRTPEWLPATIGAGAAVAVLLLIAGAMAVMGARRR